MKLRINKLISDAGLGSRRDVEEYIRLGRVKINGRRAQLSDLVSETDVVFFDEVDLPVKELIQEHAAEEKLHTGETFAVSLGKDGKLVYTIQPSRTADAPTRAKKAPATLKSKNS